MTATGASPWFLSTEWVEQEPEVSGGRASVEELTAAVWSQQAVCSSSPTSTTRTHVLDTNTFFK